MTRRDRAITGENIGRGRRALASLTIACGAAFLALWPADASAATTCSYSAATQTLTVAGDPNVGTNLFVTGIQIQVAHRVANGGSLVACAGGSPTTANTDAINLTHTSPDQTTEVTISDPEKFGPGAFNEMAPGGIDCPDEIEIEIDLGDGRDVVAVDDLDGSDDSMVLGTNGIDRDPPGSSLCSDRDITATVDDYDLDAAGGTNAVSAQGNEDTGDPLITPLVYKGGSGADQVTGGNTADDLDGGDGADVLRGANGNDWITGGPGGQDRLFGDLGEDGLFAEDGTADSKIRCGPGASTAEFAVTDRKKDPRPKSC